MPESDEQRIANLIAEFERTGDRQVRLLLNSGGYPSNMRPLIIKWLIEKDDARRKAEEARQREQDSDAKWANSRDNIAAAAAIIAAIAAIVGAFISYFAWVHPHAA